MVRRIEQSSLSAGLFVQEQILSSPQMTLASYFSPGGVQDPYRADDQTIIVLDSETHLIAIDGVPAPWVPGEPPVLIEYNGSSLTSGQIPGAIYSDAIKCPSGSLLEILESATVRYRDFLTSQEFNWEDKSRRYLYGGACVSHACITDTEVSVLALGDCIWAVRLKDGQIISSEDWVSPAQRVADFLLKNLHSDPLVARRTFNRVFKPWQRGYLANHLGGTPENWDVFTQELLDVVDDHHRKAEIEVLLDNWLISLQDHSYLFFDGATLPHSLCQHQVWRRGEVSELIVCSDGAFDRQWQQEQELAGFGRNLFSLIDEGGVEAVRAATEQRARKSPDHTGPIGPESCLIYCKLHY